MVSLAEKIVVFRKQHLLIIFDIRSENNSDVRDWFDCGIVDIGLFGESVDVTKYFYIRIYLERMSGKFSCQNRTLF